MSVNSATAVEDAFYFYLSNLKATERKWLEKEQRENNDFAVRYRIGGRIDLLDDILDDLRKGNIV